MVRNKGRVGFTRANRVTSTQVDSALVVYTQIPAISFLPEIRKRNGEVGQLIHSVRQKQGHIILMASRADREKLVQRIQTLRNLGLRVRPYVSRNPRASMLINANNGIQKHLEEAQMCNNMFQNVTCPYAMNCRFKCYKDIQD